MRERSETAKEQVLRGHGVRQIAVDLIRQGREGLKYVLDSNIALK